MSKDDLKDLDQKIAAYRQSETERGNAADGESVNTGAQAGLELVASILAGLAIGWGLDHWLGTKPWMLIVFLFLGVGTGFRSVYKISNNLGVKDTTALQNALKNATKPPEIPDDDDD